MTRTALDPIPIGTTPITVNVGGQLAALTAWKFGNESDTTLRWQWGEEAGYLYPSEVDVLRPRSTSPMQAVFTPTNVLPPSLSLTRNLLVEFAWRPDDFGGDWPQQMSRLSQVATPRNQIWPDGTPPASQTGHSVTIAAGVGNTTRRFTIPSGANTMRVLIQTAGVGFGVGNFWGLLAVGVQSNDEYIGAPNSPGGVVFQPPNQFLPVQFQVDAELDRQVDITFFNPSAVLAYTADVAWSTATEVFQVVNQLPLEVQTTRAAAWQQPYQAAVLDGSTLAAGATLTIVTGVPNTTVFVHDVELRVTAATNFLVEDTTAVTRIGAGVAPAAGVALGPIDWKGFQDVQTGAGVRINMNGGLGGTFFGRLGYTQA